MLRFIVNLLRMKQSALNSILPENLIPVGLINPIVGQKIWWP